MSAQTVTYNKATALTQNVFEKVGYTFSGWNTKEDGSGTSYADKANITATVNTTIYAQWTANAYTIAFNKNNSSASGTMANMSMTYGTAKTLTTNTFAVTTAGVTSKQVFNGWNTKADGTGTSYADKASVNNLSSTNGATVTLYAQWIDANYEVSSPVKYTLKLGEAVNAANGSATITVLKDNTDDSSVSINKTLTLALNGKTLTRTAWMFLKEGTFTFTISGSGLLKTPTTGEYGIIQGSGGTLATSNSPTIICTSNMIIGNDMDLNLQGGTLITTMRSVITIYNWNTATIKNTNILCVPRNKNALLAYNKNGKDLTIDDSILANGSGEPAVDANTNPTATTIHYASTGTLYIKGSSKITSGPNNESTICTPDATLHGVSYSGKGSKIDISGSTSIFAYGRCLNVSCSKITINTTGYLGAVGDYAVYNQDQTATLAITRGIFISRDSSHCTIYNNGTKSGLSSEAYPGKTRTYTYYMRNGNTLKSETYERDHTYVYRKQ